MDDRRDDRREFLKRLAAFTAALGAGCKTAPEARPGGGPPVAAGAAAAPPARDRLGPLLPARLLGRTGQAVSMLGVGGWHFGNMSEAEAEATLEAAIAGGVRFFDTAVSYQDGGSESRMGTLVVPRYRGDIFLMTKTTAKDKAGALRELDDSLRRLGTDHLDLWQMHSVGSPEDVDRRVENGVVDAFVEAKKAGKTRFIGFTGHKQPAAHLRVLERTDVFETCQMPINVADPGYESFIVNVLPKLVERNIGVLAMKTLANGGFFGGSEHGKHGPKPRVVPNRVSMQEAIHFVWSLPVAVLISGADDAAMLREKIALARSFTGLGPADRDRLVAKVADMAGREVEFYKG